MLKCNEIVDNATDYLDKQQSWGKNMVMALHLLMCGKCRRFIKYFKLSIQSLQKKQTITQEDAEQLSSVIITKARSENQ